MQNLPIKAVLLLDNAPSHPVELKTEDGAIFVMFMPPNVTPLIQPMDQNALRLTKLHYRNRLLKYVVASGENMAESLKSLTMKDAIIYLNQAWQQLDPSIIKKCWNNIFNENDIDEDDLPLARLQEQRISQNSEPIVQETIELLQLIGPVSKKICRHSMYYVHMYVKINYSFAIFLLFKIDFEVFFEISRANITTRMLKNGTKIYKI